MNLSAKSVTEILDWLIWAGVGFYVLIAHWIWFGRGPQETLIIVLCAIAIAFRSPSQVFGRKFALPFFLGLVALGTSICATVLASSTGYLIEDTKSMLGPTLVLLYLFQFYERDTERCNRFVAAGCKVLAVYMWLNSVLIIAQSQLPYFMMNTAAIQAVSNPMYEDQLTGLLGINGTTRWCIASCVVSVYYVSKCRRNDGKSLLPLAKAAAFIALCLYISTLNESRSIFVLLPIVLLTYFVLKGRAKVVLRGGHLFALVAVASACLAAYYAVPSIHSYVDSLIADKVHIYLSGSFDYMVAANDDRARALSYALSHGGAFGAGVGSVPMHFSNEEVKYMGLSSVSSYIYMTGVFGYFCYTAFLASLCRACAPSRYANRFFLVMLAALLVFSYLLPVYSSIALIFGFGLVALLVARTCSEWESSANRRGAMLIGPDSQKRPCGEVLERGVS